MKIRRKPFLGIVLILLVLVSGGVWLYARRSPQLLQQATRVPAFGGPNGIDAYRYEWVTPNTLLIDNTVFEDPIGPALGPSKGQHALKMANLSLAAAAPLPAITAIMNSTQSYNGSISPDSKWIYWQSLQGKQQIWNASTLDGKHQISWPRLEPWHSRHDGLASTSYLQWAGPEHRLAEIEEIPLNRAGRRAEIVLFVHNLDTGAVEQERYTSPFDPNRAGVISPTTTNLLVAEDWNRYRIPTFESPESSRHLQTYVWQRGDVRKTPTVNFLDAPTGTMLQEIALSPDGKRIAWEVERPMPVPYYRSWLERLWRQKRLSNVRRELWESGINGAEMHLIGSLDLPTTPDPAEVYLHITWLPDSKSVSFEYEGSLWRVPVRPR